MQSRSLPDPTSPLASSEALKSKISRNAVWEAKKELNIRAMRVSDRWWWELPGQTP